MNGFLLLSQALNVGPPKHVDFPPAHSPVKCPRNNSKGLVSHEKETESVDIRRGASEKSTP